MSKATVTGDARRSMRRNEVETDEAADVDQSDGRCLDDDLEASAELDAEPADESDGVDPDADLETADSEKDEKEHSGPRVLSIGRIGVLAPALAAGALVVLLIVLGVSNYQHRSSDAAGDAARTEVTRHVTSMLSYTPATVADFPGNEAWLTGGFKSKYHSLMSDKVAPEAKQTGVSATAQVVHAAVTSASSDRVEMLMFINVKLTAKGSATPQETGSRVRVGATKVDGHWLIDRFDTV